MRSIRITRIIVALAGCALIASSAHDVAAAQTTQQNEAAAQREAPASVEGRVTLEGRGAPGVLVGLMPAEFGPDRRAVARARTDAEGHYRMGGIAPGRYYVVVSAPAYVVGGSDAASGWPSGTAVMLAAGEKLEDVDFTLERGGVITGRVTDADGRAVSGESVRIMSVEEEAQGRRLPSGSQMWRTDDRGVYRLYGLPEGRYKVYVGVDTSRGAPAFFGRSDRGYYARTFHPNVAEVADAKVVEVSAGGEATDVDVVVGRPSKTFNVRGRVVDAATGKPAARVTFGYDVVDPRTRRMIVSGGGMRSQTNARGEFEMTGLLPGHYAAFASADGTAGLYGDVVPFEIKDADVSGLEVKLHAGSSLSGVVAVEGTADRALVAQLLQQLRLYPRGDPRQGLTPERYEPVRVGPDGSFHITGLRPGKVLIGHATVKGLSLGRLELNGVEQRDALVEVAEGAHVTGLRLVLFYGTGRIRGQVVLRNGEQPATLPPNARLNVVVRRRVETSGAGGAGGTGGGSGVGARAGDVDARGRFLIEGLAAGEFELTVTVFGPRVRAQAGQLVSVNDAGETSVTLTLDLSQNQLQPPRPARRPPAENP